MAENKRKKRHRERIIVPNITEYIPNSKLYIKLMAAEKKLDTLVSRKRLELYDWMLRPHRVTKKLRVSLITNHTTNRSILNNDSSKSNESNSVLNSWEFRIEGKLIDETSNNSSMQYYPEQNNQSSYTYTDYSRCIKRRFSDFFQSLHIEMEGDVEEPKMFEWQRNLQTQETDGFCLKRSFISNKEIKLSILMTFNHDPPQFKLDSQLGRLLGVHTQTRARIINALWIYIKNNKLIDCKNRQLINCDKYLKQIFSCETIELESLCKLVDQYIYPPEPISIYYTIYPINSSNSSFNTNDLLDKWTVVASSLKPLFFETEVETDDPIKVPLTTLMNNFNTTFKPPSLNTNSENEIQILDTKINGLIEQIKKSIEKRQFYLEFAEDPVRFIHKFIMNQTEDMCSVLNQNPQYAVKRTDSNVTPTVTSNGISSSNNIVDLTKCDVFTEPWIAESVQRYIFHQIQMNRLQMETAIINKASFSLNNQFS